MSFFYEALYKFFFFFFLNFFHVTHLLSYDELFIICAYFKEAFILDASVLGKVRLASSAKSGAPLTYSGPGPCQVQVVVVGEL